MIRQKYNNVVAMRINGLKILAVYTHGHKIADFGDYNIKPEEILSCFYNGYWIDDYPWTDDTPWTD